MRRRRAPADEGIALVVTLMAMTLLLALCSALVLMTATETRVVSNDHDGIAAFYAADSAVALAVGDLRRIPDWGDAVGGAVTSSLTEGPPSGQRTLADGDTIDLDQERPIDASGMPWRLFAYGALATWLQGTSVDPRIYVAVWVRDDPAGGGGPLTVRGRAYGPQHARRSVEVVIRRAPAGGSPTDPPVERLSWRER